MHNGFLRPYSSRISFLQRVLDVVLILCVYWLVVSCHDAEWNAQPVSCSIGYDHFFALC